MRFFALVEVADLPASRGGCSTLELAAELDHVVLVFGLAFALPCLREELLRRAPQSWQVVHEAY